MMSFLIYKREGVQSNIFPLFNYYRGLIFFNDIKSKSEYLLNIT